VVILSLKLDQKGLIYYYVYANVSNRIVWSFVWRKLCRDWRMMRGDEEWTKAQAWGCPRGTPSSSAKIR
jgi:hypothetical protein